MIDVDSLKSIGTIISAKMNHYSILFFSMIPPGWTIAVVSSFLFPLWSIGEYEPMGWYATDRRQTEVLTTENSEFWDQWMSVKLSNWATSSTRTNFNELVDSRRGFFRTPTTFGSRILHFDFYSANNLQMLEFSIKSIEVIRLLSHESSFDFV